MRLATVVVFTAFATLVACSDDAQKQGELPANNQGADASTNAGTDAGLTVEGTVPTDELEVCIEGWYWFHPRPYGSNLQAVHGAADEVFIVGSGGLVLRRSSGRWSAESVGDTDFYDVFAVNDQLAYAAGPALDLRAGGYVYRWDGTAWERVHTIQGEEVPGVGLPSPGFTPASIWATDEEAYVGFADRVAYFDGDQWSDVPTLAAAHGSRTSPAPKPAGSLARSALTWRSLTVVSSGGSKTERWSTRASRWAP